MIVPLLLLQQMCLRLLLLLLQRPMKNVAALEAHVDLAEARYERLVLLAVAATIL